MKIPSDYIQGYDAACALDAKMASNYVAHATIGDPEADDLIERLASEGDEAYRLIRAGMENDEEALRAGPAYVRDFFQSIAVPPEYADRSVFMPGIRMFHANSPLVLGGMVGGTLVEGFSTNISKSFFITGRLRDQGVRRLQQNNRHMLEIFMPGGLAREGEGWKLSVRIRLVHAQVRYLLKSSDEWDVEAWGTPISAAHTGFAICAFSARLLKHLKSLGAEYDQEERESFMQVWRYSGLLMGIPESILYRDEDEALRLFEIGRVCEPTPGMESAAMANSLIHSAPLIIGIGADNPDERRHLAKYVHRVSRALIGGELANQLRYPWSPTFGVLPWFRMQTRYKHIITKLRPSHYEDSSFTQFTSLLEASAYDQFGISYRFPTHVYAEESRDY